MRILRLNQEYKDQGWFAGGDDYGAVATDLKEVANWRKLN